MHKDADHEGQLRQQSGNAGHDERIKGLIVRSVRRRGAGLKVRQLRRIATVVDQLQRLRSISDHGAQRVIPQQVERSLPDQRAHPAGATIELQQAAEAPHIGHLSHCGQR